MKITPKLEQQIRESVNNGGYASRLARELNLDRNIVNKIIKRLGLSKQSFKNGCAHRGRYKINEVVALSDEFLSLAKAGARLARKPLQEYLFSLLESSIVTELAKIRSVLGVNLKPSQTFFLDESK